MEATRQAEEDALRVLKLMQYNISQSVKDELKARCADIMAGKDPYRRDLKEK